MATVSASGPSNTVHAETLEVVRLETVAYDALASHWAGGGNTDRPSIAVRDDGLVRIAITDSEGTCCPLVAPLKVATRGARGDWTHQTITSYGDHPVPHFLPSGDLGILYMDYGDH